MHAAKDTPIEHTSMTLGKDQDTFNVRTSEQKAPEEAEQHISKTSSSTEAGGEEMRKLAADMASDVEKASSQTPQVSTYLGHVGLLLIRADRRRPGFSGDRVEAGKSDLPNA